MSRQKNVWIHNLYQMYQLLSSTFCEETSTAKYIFFYFSIDQLLGIIYNLHELVMQQKGKKLL